MSLEHFVYTVSDSRDRLFALEADYFGAPVALLRARSFEAGRGQPPEQEWNSYGNVKYPGRFFSFEGEPAVGKAIVSQAMPRQWMLRPVPDQDKFYLAVPDTNFVIGYATSRSHNLELVRWDMTDQSQIWEVNMFLN